MRGNETLVWESTYAKCDNEKSSRLVNLDTDDTPKIIIISKRSKRH